MNILIYGLNYSPELTGIGKYTGEMVTWLAEHGHKCRVITSPPYYPAWQVSLGYSSWKYKKEQTGRITVYRSPLWVPSHPKTLSRIFHLLSFNLFSLPLLFFQLFRDTDVVICIAPSFFSAPLGLLLSKLTRAKSWLHFQDFEICALFGSGMASSATRANTFAHNFQAAITRHFDVVSTISQTMCVSAMKNKVSRNNIVHFPNWVDTDFIAPDADRSYFRRRWSIDTNTKIVLYSGNLGKKQGVESIVKVAYSLRESKNILFIIVGDGAAKNHMYSMVRKQGLTNILFFPLQPYEQLPALLRAADIHLVLQKIGVADSMLPSKLTSIFSVGGHALITAYRETELGRIVSANPGIATLVAPENVEKMSLSLAELCCDPNIGYGHINKVARQYAVDTLDKKTVLSQFEMDLSTLVNT